MADVGPEGLDIVRLDLGEGVPPLPARAPGQGAHVTLWWQGEPLGTLETNDQALPGRVLADRAAHAVVEAVGRRTLCTGFTFLPGIPVVEQAVPDREAVLALDRPLAALGPPREAVPLPPVTVAVCTRGRPEQLRRCLRAVAAADPAPLEVLVVDNGPSAATEAVVAAFPGVRYLAEPRPGLSVARNTALGAAAGEVVAFVDDDTEAEPGWLGPLCAPFTDEQVMATTGLVLPAALGTAAQLRFERFMGGFTRGFAPRVFDRSWLRRAGHHGAPVWEIGAGANMAVRATALHHVGPFDERLGAGASGCSEDSELWYRLLAEGWTCRYEPASVVHHHHRVEDSDVRRQTEAYIAGHLSALFVQFGRYGHAGNLVRALWSIPRWMLRACREESLHRLMALARLEPPTLGRPVLAEVSGYVRGLRYVGLAMDRDAAGRKAPLRGFLRRNPFSQPLTEGFFYREKMRAIHRVAPDVAVTDVLEVGGGRSGMARLLWPGASVTVLDADPAHAESPVNQDPRVTFVHGDACRLPFADASFDVVTMFDLLEHVEDDAAAAAEALRVVRPGGHVLVSSPNLRWHSPYHRVMAPICPTDEDMMRRWGHVRRGYALVDLERLFGSPPDERADFLNRLTVIGHDVAFSRLPSRVRRAALVVLAPLTWAAYLLQGAHRPGTETAASWRRGR